SIWNCELLDDTIAPTLAGLPSLSVLDLSYTKVGDGTLKQLTGLSKLKEVYLTDTSVTAEAAAALRANRPSVRVSWAKRPAARPVVTPAIPKGGLKTDDMELL